MSPTESNKFVGARVVLLMWLVLAGVITVRAERLPIKTYTTADGLARDHINRIDQDSSGFLWFCTAEGLSRFDGYNFINYGREQGLLPRGINAFLEAGDGNYWIATADGLYRFNPDPSPRTNGGPSPSPQKFVVYYPGDNRRQRFISALYQDRAGTIWCGTWEGLYRLDQVNGEWAFSLVNIVPAEKKADDAMLVQAILEDRTGALWINTQWALYRLRADGVTNVFAAKEGLPVHDITPAFLEDKNGRIWVGTRLGLYQLVDDPQPNRPVVARIYSPKEGTRYRISSLVQTSDGRLWVGAIEGLSEFLAADGDGGGRLHVYTSANGLSDVAINALCEDRAGNLWIGTEAGGAMKLAVNGFTTYEKADGLGGTRIGSIFENRARELCVFANESISKFEQRTFTAVPLTLPKGTTHWNWGWDQITFQDHTGEWWMNTVEGLVRYPKMTTLQQLARARPKAIYTERDGLTSNNVFRLFEDSRGDIWISTLDRPGAVLTRWERSTGTFHRYSTAEGVFEDPPTAFCEDASGNLWIGFFPGGLLRYEAGRFTPFTQSDGLPAGMVRGMHLDRAGRLWIATAEGGVARIDSPDAERLSCVTYTTVEGLSSNQATCVTEDQFGRIYVGTGRGVNRLDPATGEIKQYTTADGLANSFINVSFCDRSGALWFGTLQGLSRLVPQPERRKSPPPILISALRIAGVTQTISELGAAQVSVPELQAIQNKIQIDFVGLGLGVGESLRYQYKLEGGGADWSAPTNNRTVDYPGLSPGTYRFLVRAVTAEGGFSTAPASVTFVILPPVWQRWWFITISVFFVGSGVVAFDRYRVARLKELDAALTESQKLTEQLTEQRGELRRANRYLALESAVTGIISESSTLTEAAPRILQTVCEAAGWEIGELWYVDSHDSEGVPALRCIDVWHASTSEAAEFEAFSRTAPFLPGGGLRGHVIARAEPIFIADIAAGVDTPRMRLATRRGLHSAFGFPILLGQEALGVLELFSFSARDEDPELLEMMSTIGSHLGQLIARKRSEEALIKSREERLAELERVRRRIATDLHDDIGSSLTQISILSEVIRQKSGRDDSPNGPLSMIARSSRELVDAMSDIVWAINPRKDHLSDLTQRMRRFASDVFTARGIEFDLRVPDRTQDIKLGANLRREVFLIFKESINNMVRHSGCTQADIEFQLAEGLLSLILTDNGKGFDITSQNDGHGLISMRERANDIGGRLEILSSDGNGATVALNVALGHALSSSSE